MSENGYPLPHLQMTVRKKNLFKRTQHENLQNMNIFHMPLKTSFRMVNYCVCLVPISDSSITFYCSLHSEILDRDVVFKVTET